MISWQKVVLDGLFILGALLAGSLVYVGGAVVTHVLGRHFPRWAVVVLMIGYHIVLAGSLIAWSLTMH